MGDTYIIKWNRFLGKRGSVDKYDMFLPILVILHRTESFKEYFTIDN
jgi:type IV secretory pathway TrbF-like protein